MALDNTIEVVFGVNERKVVAPRPVFQYDHGLRLQILGLDTTITWQCHFAHGDVGYSIDTNGVKSGDYIVCDIPDAILLKPRSFQCFLYGENATTGFVCYVIAFTVIPRPQPVSVTYTEQELNQFSALVGTLNTEISELQAALESLEDNKVYIANDEDGNVTVTGNIVVEG